MIELVRISLREIRLPLVEPFRSAGGVVAERRVLLLELADASGASCWSECVAEEMPSYTPETVDTCWLAITSWLAPHALRAAFAEPEALDAAFARSVRGHRMARAAIEMGAWVLEARARGVPLARLLAARSKAAGNDGAAARPSVTAGIAMGMQPDPGTLVARARAALADGYRRVKMKVVPGRDVTFVTAVRDALGEDAPLSVDANCSYTLEEPAHVTALEALDRLGLSMIEQPLAHDDLVRHAWLQRRLVTPLCLDESIVSAASTSDMLTLGAGRMVNLKPGRVGGLTEALRIHDACARAGAGLWCGGMLETGIGRAYNVALASLPGFTEPGDLSPSARYWARDIVTPAWTMDRRGEVAVPLSAAGLGVEVDTAFVDSLTVRTTTLHRS